MQLIILKLLSAPWTKLFTLFAFLVLYTTKLAAIKIKLPRNETTLALLGFGDSILDSGNNNDHITLLKCNYPPYGRDFLGGKPTERFSDGTVPSDSFAEALGIKELLPAYGDPDLQIKDLPTGVNFASGGSGYDPLTAKITLDIPLSDQLKLFKEYRAKLTDLIGENRTRTILSKSLFQVAAGANDIVFTNLLTNIRELCYDVPSYTTLLANWASTYFKELYKIGARRIAVLSSIPLGCVPFLRTLKGGLDRKCAEEINQAAELFNAKLLSELASLNRNLPNANMVYLDFYNPLLDLIQNPEAYGFEVATKGCCGTGLAETLQLCALLDVFSCKNASAHVFWDSLHPTARAYTILVSQIIQKNLNSLFHGNSTI